MRYFYLIFIYFHVFLFSQNVYHVYFNEIRANDNSTDDIEFIELIGPAGTDLTGFKIVHYNGAAGITGPLWTHTIGTFTIPDDGITDNEVNPLGFYVLAMSGVPNTDELNSNTIQNGPDGLVLYDDADNILDAVAWGGTGDLEAEENISTSVSVSANNYLALTVNDDAGDNSLQAPDDVYNDDGSGWVLAAATPGALNSNQISGDISLPVEMISLVATGREKTIKLVWETASESENAGFEIYRSTEEKDGYFQLTSYRFNPDLTGQGTSATGHRYTFIDSDPTLKSENVYYYQIADVSYNGEIHFNGPVSAQLNINEDHDDPGNPARFLLLENYPNPFNPTTTIRIVVNKSGDYGEVTVFNLLGRKIKTLWQKQMKAGENLMTWDGKDQNGKAVASGIYFCRLISGQKVIMKKMVLMR